MWLPSFLCALSSSSPPKFCYMCLNGGKLHLCDHCPWAVCHQCLPPPHYLDISTLDFVCLACHEVTFMTALGRGTMSLPSKAQICIDAWPLETCHSPAPCHPRPISNDLPLPSQLRQPPYSPFYSGES